jgi:hypothetical protein
MRKICQYALYLKPRNKPQKQQINNNKSRKEKVPRERKPFKDAFFLAISCH